MWISIQFVKVLLDHNRWKLMGFLWHLINDSKTILDAESWLRLTSLSTVTKFTTLFLFFQFTVRTNSKITTTTTTITTTSKLWNILRSVPRHARVQEEAGKVRRDCKLFVQRYYLAPSSALTAIAPWRVKPMGC